MDAQGTAEPRKINGWLLAVDRGPQFLSLLLLFFLPFVIRLNSPNPVSIKRILASMLVAFILVFWTLKPAIEGKWTVVWTPALLPGALLILWCLATVAVSPYPVASWNAWRDWIWVPLWFFLLTQTCHELWRAENLLLTFMAASLGTALWGIGQSLGWPPGDLVFAVRLEFGGGVIAGLGKPHYLAGYLLLVWPIALALMMRAKSRFATVFWAVTLASSLSCLALTRSLSGWLGAWAGILAFAALMWKDRASFKKGWIALGLAAILFLGVAMTEPMSRGLSDLFKARNPDRTFRAEVWKGALDILSGDPLFGSGFGTFRAAFPSHRSIPMMMRETSRNYEVQHADNFILEWASETGIVGILLLSVFWVAVAWPWWKLYRTRAIPPALGAAAFAAFLGSGVGNLISTDHTLPTTGVPLLFLGALTGPLSQRFLGLPGYPVRKWVWDVRRFRWVALLLSLTAVVAALSNARDGLNRQWSDIELKKAIDRSSPGHWDEAIVSYEKALRLHPGNLMAGYFLAYVLMERDREGDRLRVLESFERVASVEPDYSQIHLKRSQALGKVGDESGAQREMDQAIRLDPQSIDESADFKRARELSRRGRRTEALAVLQALTVRHPLCPPLWYEIGVIRTMMKRPDEAIEAYRKALSLYPAYVDALRNLGYVASTAGRMDEVLRVVDSLKRAFPGEAWVAGMEREFGQAASTPTTRPGK